MRGIRRKSIDGMSLKVGKLIVESAGAEGLVALMCFLISGRSTLEIRLTLLFS